MTRALAVMVMALSGTLMSSALAQDPLPLPPVVLPVPPVIPTLIPAPEPEGIAPLVVPAEQCDAVLQQMLAELDYWRAQSPRAVVTIPVDLSPARGGISESDRPRVMQVAAVLKEMKGPDAALVLADWDDQLATEVLARLPSRASGAIATALPPAHAARLYARLSLLAITPEAP